MGEILGLTISDFPYHRFKPQFESGVIQGNQARGWTDRPDLNDSKTWPEELQKLWSNDQGYITGEKLQKTQIEQFRKIRVALDEFKPDAIMMMFRDLGEAWGPVTDPANKRPKYWLHLEDADSKTVEFYNFGPGRVAYNNEPIDQTETFKIHRGATQYLIDALKKDAPVQPEVATEVKHPRGMGHNFIAGVVHTDWDQRKFETPFIALGVDPFGFARTRSNEGLSPWDKSQEPPLTPKEAFEIGRVLARAIKASPYRIALAADVDWSHANDTAHTNFRLSPDSDADRKRFEQWSAGNFTDWGDSWSFEDMEAHAEWELLVTIILAGAMTEVGAAVKYAHFQENTAIFNDDMVTTIFEAK